MNRPSSSPASVQESAVFARKLTAHLTEAEQHLPYVVTERLRAAREQAIDLRKRSSAPLRQVQAAGGTSSMGVQADGTLTLGQHMGDPSSTGTPLWLRRLLTALPLAALALGLAFIGVEQDTRATVDVADVDAALLTSALPPAAYTDPGFLQFLQTSHANTTP